jgi:elongation factor Ts
MIELNCETDFVARTEKFSGLAKKISDLCLENATDGESLLSLKIDKDSVSESISILSASTGENVRLGRSAFVSVGNGVVSSYVHSAISPNFGKIGVLVMIGSSCPDSEKLLQFGKKIAIHVAAAYPLYLSENDVPDEVVNKERNIALEQARISGKKEEIAAKIVDGRIKKYLSEIVLLNQEFLLDTSLTISEVVDSFSREIGAPVSLLGFKRIELGVKELES